jgi:homoserine dehydrogenase
MTTTKIAIVGFGTVGGGVARLLTEAGDRLARHAGSRLELAKVVVRDPSKPRSVELPSGVMTTDLAEVTGNAEITTVCQLIGGVEPARSIMLELLESGKDVITANKALIAEHGPELFDRARELGRSIAFEASVAGGIPIIANIGQCLSANAIHSLHGILNGTSNFILTQMEQRGADYATALAEAQERGYAEADPSMDVDGTDAAQKLAILSHLAFGSRVEWRDIPCRGIDGLDTADMHYASELGYRIKLLAVAETTSEGLELHVSPTLIKHGTPMADVHSVYNAVRVVGDAVGNVFFHGHGAGEMPTASAVVADLVDTVAGRAKITFERLELWSKRTSRVSARDFDNVRSKYYLRMNVSDQPAVLSEVTSVLGKHGVSIASIIQHEGCDGEDRVPLVFMTHEATEGATREAVEEIDKLTCVGPPSIRMRVHEP